ncbi:MAG: YHS domain-containing protein [Bacteroidota bacterium]|nr:YHS domain-containing protein [Bacteroidota bacterium]
MAKCPTCGMEVDEKNAPAKTGFKGETYYFCSNGCKTAFDKDPQVYVDKIKSSGQQHEHKH